MLSLLLMCSSITPAILTWERHRIPAYSTSNAIMSYDFNNTAAPYEYAGTVDYVYAYVPEHVTY